jgi:transporter family-2 protein
MHNFYFYILLAIAAGVALSVQVGVNSSLRIGLNSALFAALFSFGVGTVGLLAYALVTRAPWPSLQVLSKVPAWAWFGGFLGAYYVVTAILAAPKLGAASLISLIVTAQLCTSLVLDHFGLIGFAQHGINVWRIAGALLLIAGVTMIVRN